MRRSEAKRSEPVAIINHSSPMISISLYLQLSVHRVAALGAVLGAALGASQCHRASSGRRDAVDERAAT